MKVYLDSERTWDEVRTLEHGFYKNFARFDAKKTRERILKRSVFREKDIRPFLIRPMDIRWCYYTDLRPLWNEPRPAYIEQLWRGNATIMTRRKGVADPEGVPFFFTSYVGFQHVLNTDAYYIPLAICPSKLKGRKRAGAQIDLLEGLDDGGQKAVPNLSSAASAYLDSLGRPKDSALWMHILAIGYSPAYLQENEDGIRQDWPRIPLPNSREALAASVELGHQVAALLDDDSPVGGVTSGEIRPELRLFGVITRLGGGNLQDSDLALRAGWGHAGKGGVTMPGKGNLAQRQYSTTERKGLLDGCKALGLSESKLMGCLGDTTYDVYLNDKAFWSNVPEKVWDYTIGGYPVIKKWLSYREEKLLGRPLTKDEARYVQQMVRRLAALLLLQPALDRNYETVKAASFSWTAGVSKA